jgi:serine acetyltransferase
MMSSFSPAPHFLGRITIGRGSVIGGNVWLTRSVPAGSNVTQQQLSGLGIVPQPLRD